jgi:hypothetical protein
VEAPQPSPAEHQEIRLDLPRDPEWASLLRLTAAGLAVYFNFSTELIDDLKLIVTEAFGHAIASAPGSSRIRCAFDVSSDRIRIVVDADAPYALAGVDDSEVSLFVLRALVDEVRVSGGERYHLSLTKALG